MPLALGGMARIYIGRTTGIGSFERHVVLKLITPERANDHTAVQMFLDEARLAAALNHQNVAQVFEVGEDGGIHYLAMEYVHGQDLRALLAKAGSQGTRVPLELALTVVTGAAAGLNHAHERRGQDGVPLGIVHRDVSPSNIMVGYDGSVKLLDFGIAKATQRSIETQSGIIKGKFAYMAPEQCRGRDVDRRSDVFSLGIILYEITTQHRCFRADSDFDTMHRIVTGDVVRPTRLIQGYPQALEAIVMKALAVDPTQRYQSAGALLEALESFAVAARMSLSTMSLGRFMRDMFGDLTEPWLTQPGRATQQPMQPRESTISNTNGTGSDVVHARAATPAPVEMSPAQLQSARTVLDLPPGSGAEDPEPNAAEWNAKSYPTMQPAYAPPPEHVARTSSPALPGARTSSPALPVVQGPQTPPGGLQRQSYPQPPYPQQQQPSGPVGSATPALGSQPLQVQHGQVQHSPVPHGAFPPGPGSGSGPAHGMPSTRQGYTSGAPTRGDVSYPRYEPPPGSLDDDDDLRLRPNRRPLFIGLGIAGVGLIILLVMTLGGGGGDEGKEQPIVMDDQGSNDDGSDAGSNKVSPVDPTPDPTTDPKVVPNDVKVGSGATGSAAPDTTTNNNTGSGAAPIEDQSITIDIKTDPIGADVILAGKVIGMTPLKTKRPKSKGMSMITVHKARYIDVTAQFDLGEDFTSDLKLKKADEPVTNDTKKTGTDIKKTGTDTKKTGTDTKKDPKRTGTTTVKNPGNTTTVKNPGAGSGTVTTPKKKDCQPPAQYNPLDDRPVCK